MKKKDTVINIKPFEAKVFIHSKGFTLNFVAKIGDDYSRKKIVKIHFDDWWLKVIAKLLWSVIKQRRSDLLKLEIGMSE